MSPFTHAQDDAHLTVHLPQNDGTLSRTDIFFRISADTFPLAPDSLTAVSASDPFGTPPPTSPSPSGFRELRIAIESVLVTGLRRSPLVVAETDLLTGLRRVLWVLVSSNGFVATLHVVDNTATLIDLERPEPAAQYRPGVASRWQSNPTLREHAALADVFATRVGVQVIPGFPATGLGFGIGPASAMRPINSLSFDLDHQLLAGTQTEFLALDDPASWGLVPLDESWWVFDAHRRPASR